MLFKTSLFVLALNLAAQDMTTSLDQLIEEALQRNPSISRSAAELRVLESRIEPAGTLPDPQLSLGVMSLPVDSWSFNQEAMTQKTIRIMQGLPIFGKLSLQKDLAELEREMAREELTDTRRQIVKMVKTTYYDLYFISRALAITRDTRALMLNMVQVSEIRYRSGKGIQSDWLNSQVEVLKLDERLTNLELEKATLKAKMNILLNRNPQQPLSDPLEITPFEKSLVVHELQEKALQNNPMLRRKAISIEKGLSAIKLVHREYWPDLEIDVTYGQREGMTDVLSGEISLSLPLYAWRKQSQRLREFEASLSSAKFDYTLMQNELFFQIQLLVEELTRSKQLMELYKNQIIPQSEQAYQSALAAYSNDQLDYNSLLRNLIMLFTNQLEYENNRNSFNKALAELEALTEA